ncbi:MAG TPA: tRNA uridine-5-carboxymethylaminomethyl(34) synthesis enzyme MnmG [Clostridia bacterium]|nr:tRNA uridine-5-carboxymethylaminomethyl(34) synthesis enzyme MnmG [Clostridia bacterium]
MEYQAGNYDVAVIGAGHAGIEAALAAARLGCKTVIFTINLDAVGNMPCNPSIGGSAKGHLVREIDALGGQMGKAADQTFLQSRMLNRGKGPAVHSLRVQSDRREYQKVMKHTLELQKGLDLKQAEVIDVRVKDGKVESVVTKLGAVYKVKAVILATGTYLKGKIHIGEISYDGGPDGMFGADALSDCLKRLGIEMMRFKTGTPARVNRSSINFDKLEEQQGDEKVVPFSFETEGEFSNQVVCHIAYTNNQTHEVIRENLSRSPLYSGRIEGVGPRYCPSIEDKVVRFADKERHQIFVEPLGIDTEEMYLGGMSSSLPEEVQQKFLQTISGFENIKMMRTAYAIEYDCVNPLELKHTLEIKKIIGLFGAGQFNGTSGYEEAAAQGLVAGINAALEVGGREPLVLDRSESYIGTLIDDLVIKGTNEPYRMMTSRSEYRLVLRQDNADERLTPTGYKIGLIAEQRYRKFQEKMNLIRQEKERLEKTNVPPSHQINEFLCSRHTAPLSSGIRLSELLKRPQIDYDSLTDYDLERKALPEPVTEQVEIQLKYEGYIKRQMTQIKEMQRLEIKKIPKSLDFDNIRGLRLEARDKLKRIRPENIGQASRISGVNPADIAVLLIYLEANLSGVGQ